MKILGVVISLQQLSQLPFVSPSSYLSDFCLLLFCQKSQPQNGGHMQLQMLSFTVLCGNCHQNRLDQIHRQVFFVGRVVDQTFQCRFFGVAVAMIMQNQLVIPFSLPMQQHEFFIQLFVLIFPFSCEVSQLIVVLHIQLLQLAFAIYQLLLLHAVLLPSIFYSILQVL